MGNRIYDAKYWRALALVLRAEAEKTRDPGSKQMLLRIVQDYEQLAGANAPTDGNPNEQARTGLD